MDRREGWATGKFRLPSDLISKEIQDEYLRNKEILDEAMKKKAFIEAKLRKIAFNSYKDLGIFDQVKDIDVIYDIKSQKIQVSYSLRYADDFRPAIFVELC